MTPEDEEFNRIERESRIKQEYIRAMKQEQVPMDVVLEMRDYIRVLENLVRELGDRLAKLEKGKEPLTCPICNATAYPYPKCGCVYYKEKNNG